jgi:hypothetical protein
MTYEQYWQMEPSLVIAYRKAEELRNERRNQELWMQGMYIYEALCDVSVLIPRFSKKKIKPVPYATKPYPLRSEMIRKAEDEVRGKMEKARRTMDSFATKVNAMFAAKKGGKEHG